LPRFGIFSGGSFTSFLFSFRVLAGVPLYSCYSFGTAGSLFDEPEVPFGTRVYFFVGVPPSVYLMSPPLAFPGRSFLSWSNIHPPAILSKVYSLGEFSLSRKIFSLFHLSFFCCFSHLRYFSPTLRVNCFFLNPLFLQNQGLGGRKVLLFFPPCKSASFFFKRGQTLSSGGKKDFFSRTDKQSLPWQF